MKFGRHPDQNGDGEAGNKQTMDELEKKVPEVEVTEVEATEVETPEVEAKEAETPELEAAAGEPTEGACVAETEEAPARNVHAMSKEELVAAMKEILENDKMESHREVTAMKQAFFSLRSRERLEELNALLNMDKREPEVVAETEAPDNSQQSPTRKTTELER